MQNGIPCFLLDLFLAFLPSLRLQEFLLQAGSGGLHGLEELVQHGVQTVGGIFPRGLRSLALRGQHPLLRVLDHPHIFLAGFSAHHIRHDLHCLVVGRSRNFIDQCFHVVDLEGQFVQPVLLDGKLFLLLGKDEVLLFQIFAVAVLRFFLQIQPMTFGNLEQHLSTGGIKGDLAVVAAAEGYVTRMALDEEGEVIGYEFVKLGKMLEDIRHGKSPNEAYEANIGNYGRFANAAKYIDPREE